MPSARFFLVGSASYFVYFGLLSIGMALELGSFSMGVLSGLSFLAVSVGSYFAHRFYTYMSDKPNFGAMTRYAFVIMLGSAFSGTVSFLARQSFVDSNAFFATQIACAFAWSVISYYLLRYLVY